MRAFAPANISCIFKVYDAPSDEKKGSLGVGFTLSRGVIVRVKKAKKTKIIVNGKDWSFPTVESVVKKLSNLPLEVKIRSFYPFGAGFGMSGASALAASFAINEYLGLNKTERPLAMIAHISEVENKTGRGDVGGQFNGGFMWRDEEGDPLKVKQLPVKEKTIYVKVYAPIETKKIIGDKKKLEKINKAGSRALKRVEKLKKVDLARITEISKDFAQESGLLTRRLKKDIGWVEKHGGKASMIMLGEALYSTIPFPGSEKARIAKARVKIV